MRALVYHGPGHASWDTVPDPEIAEATDAIVRVDATTICGSDLRILRGDLPEVKPGTVLGHEAVGDVVAVGGDVQRVRTGDQVIVSAVSACGRCRECRNTAFGQCSGGGGWVLGNEIHGTQAELVRVPFADRSTHPRDQNVPIDESVLLCDVLPTAYEVGVRDGHVGPGDTVVVVGGGPIGLASMIIARLYSPRRVVVVDLSTARLETAARLGADATELPGKVIADLSEGPGADVVIEATGEPDGFVLSTRLVRNGGHIATIGMHGKPVTLHLESLWRKNVTIATGQVDTFSTPWLLGLVRYGDLHVSGLVTDSLPLDRVEDAYEAFAQGTTTGALKIMLHR
ncbi:alcohol dehydrogenase catalytic domain-containing protein [Streptomyces nigra]|uniref:alcohol dehydrogenase catalytic domain-containing protein n=1 Tax=Streptomyces nigra TaxID=1827580 RepID=UPI0036C2436E